MMRTLRITILLKNRAKLVLNKQLFRPERQSSGQDQARHKVARLRLRVGNFEWPCPFAETGHISHLF